MRIGRELYDEIIAHARAEAPKECVGVVSVRDGEAVEVHRARNAEDSRLRFSIDSKELYDLLMGIEDAGLDMGAIYHSHTRTAPAPVPDRHQLRAGVAGRAVDHRRPGGGSARGADLGDPAAARSPRRS